MSIERVIERIDADRERSVQDLLTVLRFPSISAQPAHAEDVQACARFVADQLADAGLTPEILPTAGHPVVYADSGPADGKPLTGGRSVKDKPTVLFYAHYDVQPEGDLSLWDSPPFEPTVRDDLVYARGAADDKGQMMTQLIAVRAWHAAAGRWPVRIKFLIEGEEEIGSPHLDAFVEANRDRLACDVVVLCDTGKITADTPGVTYSTRGLVYKQIDIDGPSHDLHSGVFGGTVLNPANVLTEIIGSMHDSALRVTLPGFYDDVRAMPEGEREALRSLPYDESAYRAAAGGAALAGEEGYVTLERRSVRPTLDVNGINGGYTGDGAATIIPRRAFAKVSMRLVPNQDPERISAAFDAFVRRACPEGLKLHVETLGMCSPYVAPLDSPRMQAAARAVERAYGVSPALIPEGGTLPILAMFKSVLGADSLMPGFALPDCNAHGPNEVFALSDLHAGARTIAYLLDELERV